MYLIVAIVNICIGFLEITVSTIRQIRFPRGPQYCFQRPSVLVKRQLHQQGKVRLINRKDLVIVSSWATTVEKTIP